MQAHIETIPAFATRRRSGTIGVLERSDSTEKNEKKRKNDRDAIQIRGNSWIAPCVDRRTKRLARCLSGILASLFCLIRICSQKTKTIPPTQPLPLRFSRGGIGGVNLTTLNPFHDLCHVLRHWLIGLLRQCSYAAQVCPEKILKDPNKPRTKHRLAYCANAVNDHE